MNKYYLLVLMVLLMTFAIFIGNDLSNAQTVETVDSQEDFETQEAVGSSQYDYSVQEAQEEDLSSTPIQNPSHDPDISLYEQYLNRVEIKNQAAEIRRRQIEAGR